MADTRDNLSLVLIILCSIIIGGFIGEFFKDNSLLGFLSWGFPIGTTDDLGNIKPIVVNLKMIQFSLGLLFQINFASITALGLGLYLHSKMH